MQLDRGLVHTIKFTFAEYSSKQLEEIAAAKDHEQWSEEAVEAAREILGERGAGRADEPESPREPLPPPVAADPYSVAFVFGLMGIGAAAGFLIVPLYRRYDIDAVAADMPVAFGSKIAWLALDTTDTRAVVEALELREPSESTWADGIRAGRQGMVFVTPPLADWTLVVGTALFPPDRADTFAKPLLERLSSQFGDAQYFCSQSDFKMYVWARARSGKLVRGYGWLGQRGITLWDEGRLTREEQDLGLQFSNGFGDPNGITTSKLRLTFPDESSVTQLAYLWSIDPTTLNAHYKEPVFGMLGRLPWMDTRIRS